MYYIYRNDKVYSKKRKMALEKYFRSVLKIPSLAKGSYALHEFVNESGAILFTQDDKIYFENSETEIQRLNSIDELKESLFDGYGTPIIFFKHILLKFLLLLILLPSILTFNFYNFL